eukprot:ANDGO_02005.mRNA.1 hypothetical protein NAEGRDRAFT_79216
MSFLHHNENAPAQQSALYCSEGNQVRNCRAVRVANPPGGRSTFNIFGGYEPEQQQQQPVRKGVSPKKNAEVSVPPQRMQQVQQEQPLKNYGYSQSQSQQQQQSFNPITGQQNQAPQQKAAPEYTALYCTEGNQVRNCRAVRVSNPPGGKSSFSLGGY